MSSRLTSSGCFPGRPTGRRPEQAGDETGPTNSAVSVQLSELVSRLGLGPEDIAALARRGFVAEDRRPGGRRYFKLRWRSGGRQRVRYLGDADRASQVRRALALLQRERAAERELAQLRREARRLLRASKSMLAPWLKDTGFHFHGLAIRRRDARP